MLQNKLDTFQLTFLINETIIIINLFENIYLQIMISVEDVVKVIVIDAEILKWEPFQTNKQTNTNAKSMGLLPWT